MTESSSGDTRLNENPTGIQLPVNDLNRAELEAIPQPTQKRERLFSRRVLIGWAALALAAYLGVHFIESRIKRSVTETIQTVGAGAPTRDVIYVTPIGRITVSRDKEGTILNVSRSPNVPAAPRVPPPAKKP